MIRTPTKFDESTGLMDKVRRVEGFNGHLEENWHGLLQKRTPKMPKNEEGGLSFTSYHFVAWLMSGYCTVLNSCAGIWLAVRAMGYNRYDKVTHSYAVASCSLFWACFSICWWGCVNKKRQLCFTLSSRMIYILAMAHFFVHLFCGKKPLHFPELFTR